MIDSISRRLVYDSLPVDVRHLSSDSLRRFRADDDFNYDTKRPSPPASLWERFTRWLNDLIDRMLPNGENKTFWDWMAWIVVGAALVLVIMNMSGVRGIFFRKAERGVSDFAVIEENIDEMNFDVLIERAVAERNFRRGVRLLYLKSLKDLSDRGLIAFRKSLPLAILGVALIVAPHVVGAPQPDSFETAIPEGLHHQFVVAVTLTNLVFWLVLGVVVGVVRGRFSGTATSLRDSFA